ncbi:MAG TPA: HNH endonuclease [Gemmatimonadaceae bacterium]|nr:HNH endonuclease [Gemmatimonadaceae bacterium]
MTREEIFARDEHRCVYCGRVYPAAALTLDHVQPRLRGGDRTAGNLVTACGACNVLKGHRSLAHYLADDAEARANFFRLAVHVWPRHLRAVRQELAKRGVTDS